MIHKFVLFGFCACVWKAVLPAVTFSGIYIGKSFVSKGGLLGFFSLLPTLEPEFWVCDRILCLWYPSPRHCGSWWCHKWRIILAGETDELGRNKDLLCLQLSLVRPGEVGVEGKYWASRWPALPTVGRGGSAGSVTLGGPQPGAAHGLLTVAPPTDFHGGWATFGTTLHNAQIPWLPLLFKPFQKAFSGEHLVVYLISPISVIYNFGLSVMSVPLNLPIGCPVSTLTILVSYNFFCSFGSHTWSAKS